MRLDWHLHSHFSDGRFEPARVVRAALERGVRVMALTDHDTVAGLSAAAEEIRLQGWSIQLVAGMELTARWGDREIHVLGLGFDPSHPAIREWENRLTRARWDRAIGVLERLEAAGFFISESCLRDEMGPATAPTRQHLARAIVRAGVARSARAAFARFLVRKGVAHVSMVVPDLKEATEAIHAAGGVTSLAHAGRYGPLSGGYVALAKVGLDALEIVHPAHDGGWRAHLLQEAQALGLGATSGSDDHGEVPAQPPTLVPHSWIEPLIETSQALARVFGDLNQVHV